MAVWPRVHFFYDRGEQAIDMERPGAWESAPCTNCCNAEKSLPGIEPSGLCWNSRAKSSGPEGSELRWAGARDPEAHVRFRLPKSQWTRGDESNFGRSASEELEIELTHPEHLELSE